MLDNQITKEELEQYLNTLGIPVNDYISKDNTSLPRIVFGEIEWVDTLKVKEDYGITSKYEIVFYSKIPRHPKLIELRNLLREKLGFRGNIFHRFIKESKTIESYCYIELYEDETQWQK